MGNFELNFEEAHVGGKNVGKGLEGAGGGGGGAGGGGAGGGGAGGGGLGHIVIPINNGERSTSPVSPSIAIPEKKYTPAQDNVLKKFIEYLRLPKNDKPYLTEPEKLILKEIFYWRETQDILRLLFRQLRIKKEQANLDKNYKKILERRPGFPNTRSRSRKSRNRKQRKTRKQ